jgi:signal peptidase I
VRVITIDGIKFETLADEILAENNQIRFSVKGFSMYPTIRNGDVIEVHRNHLNSLKNGDIILSRHNDGLLRAHRIIKVQRVNSITQITTRGDSQIKPDGAVTLKQIIGQVVAVERSGKRIRLDSKSAEMQGRIWNILSPLNWYFLRAYFWFSRSISWIKKIPSS